MDRRMAVWMGPDQLGLVKEVAAAAKLSIVAAGSWGRGLSSSIASELQAEPISDLRAALASIEVDLFWIASPGTFGVGAAVEDANAVSDAHSRGVKIATLEPVPAAALDLNGGGWLEGAVHPADVVRFVPRWSDSPGLRQAADVITSFGAIRAIGAQSWGAPVHGSLGSHLYGALELVTTLMGEPESIDAACAVLSAGRTIRTMPGESLRDLHGELTANLRFADGRTAGLVVSDQGGRWERCAMLFGEGGRMRIAEDGFEWIGADGQTVDESRAKRTRKADQPTSHAVTVIADGLLRRLDAPETRPINQAAILALSQTAILSARTGQSESPSTIRRMVGVE
jgi:predicted dehydrogenase